MTTRPAGASDHRPLETKRKVRNMNMAIVENAANGVSDSDYTVRHAAKRCTAASTYSARSEVEYWMLQHDAYSRRAGRCLVTATILLCAALSCMVAMAAAPAIAMVLMGLALAGRGWWCHRNAKDAWDLSVWSM